MMVVYGLIALALVSVLYLFVSIGGILWPGGPQLQPEAARNLSIALVVVGLLLCGLIVSSAVQSITVPLPPEIGGGERPGDTTDATRIAQATGTAAPRVSTGDVTEIVEATLSGPSATRSAASIEPTLTQVIPTLTPEATSTPEPASPTPTSTPAALPLDPRALIDTVLRRVIEQANAAEVAAILSGDESALDPLWSGQARDRVVENVRRVRSRFVEVTEVSWTLSGEGIRLLSSATTTATYTTSETWNFVGTIDQRCPNGSQMIRRYVETYPSEQYLLRLQAGAYTVAEWQLGRAIIDESRTICP
ncbi:MAG: hypothetical protein ACRDGG_07290 [Anaerolineae bacterium]